jgi:CRP/FNR family transcriptional regulator, anaerobic regulatory protein
MPGSGPSLRASRIGGDSNEVVRLLSRDQQSQLAGIATEVHLPPRRIVYREDSCGHCVFIVAQGTLKAFRDLPSGKRRVMAFLFRDDLFGLAEGGHYLHTAQSISAVTLYRIPIDALTRMLRSDPDLEFQFLCKVAHELRASFRQTIIVGRRDAIGRVAMFLHFLRPAANGGPRSEIEIPMSRSDAANYLGLTLEAVCRANRTLERMGIVAFIGRNAARILDPSRFHKLVTGL